MDFFFDEFSTKSKHHSNFLLGLLCFVWTKLKSLWLHICYFYLLSLDKAADCNLTRKAQSFSSATFRRKPADFFSPKKTPSNAKLLVKSGSWPWDGSRLTTKVSQCFFFLPWEQQIWGNIMCSMYTLSTKVVSYARLKESKKTTYLYLNRS